MDYINTIDPGGTGDYSSLVAWEAGEQGIVAAGDRVIAECICTNGATDTSSAGCHIDGWTISGEVIIRVPVEYRHHGVYPSSGNIYRIETTSTWMNPIRINEANVTIDGVAAKATNTKCFNMTSGATGGTTKILNCFAYGNSIDRCYDLTTYSSGDSIFVVNNFAYSGTIGFNITGATNSIIAIYNNLASNNSSHQFSTASGGTYYIKNNIAVNRTSDNYFNAYGTVYDDTNCIETNGYYTSVNVNNIIGEPNWEIGSGDFNLSPSDILVKGNGLDLSSDAQFSFDYDYRGNPRIANMWDLGPHQVSALLVNKYQMVI